MAGESTNGLTLVEQAVEAPAVERDRYVSALGVVLRLKPIAAQKVNKARQNVPVPKPPLLAPKNEGDPWIENAAHPEYVEAMERYNRTLQEIGVNVMLWEGTEVLSVPEGMFMPDSDEWVAVVEDHELMGEYAPTVKGKETPKLRYVDYLQYYALADADFGKLVDHMTRWAGQVLEHDVDEAEESFRDAPGRVPNSGGRSAAKPARG